MHQKKIKTHQLNNVERRTSNVELNIGKVGVLMGGDSSEREISLRSGRAIASALRSLGFNVIEIGESGPVEEGVMASSIDVAFLALHGKKGEDGQIQQFLENLSIPYTGSGVEASCLAMDKIASKKIFQKNGILTPRFELFCDKIKVPLVVKPSKEGSSYGMTVVKEKADLAKAIDLALSYDENILIEEYIEGRELTIGILGEETLPIVEVFPKSGVYDYSSKYTPGLTEYRVPAELPLPLAQKIQAAAWKAHQVLGCRDLSRVDFLLTKEERFFALEVNTIPGFTQTSLLPKAAQAAGISFEQLCFKILEMAVARNKKEKDALLK